jgi:hypothetical protein
MEYADLNKEEKIRKTLVGFLVTLLDLRILKEGGYEMYLKLVSRS